MFDLKWKGLRQELSELCQDLQIPEEKFSFLGIYEWQNVYDKVLSTFIDERYARTNGIHWANTENGFRKDVPEIYSFTEGQDNHLSYEWLEMLPDIVGCEKVYLLMEEAGQRSKYWIAECSTDTAHIIINESAYLKDYYITDKKYRWLITENHHGVVQFRGDIDIQIVREKNVKIVPW